MASQNLRSEKRVRRTRLSLIVVPDSQRASRIQESRNRDAGGETHPELRRRSASVRFPFLIGFPAVCSNLIYNPNSDADIKNAARRTSEARCLSGLNLARASFPLK